MGPIYSLIWTYFHGIKRLGCEDSYSALSNAKVKNVCGVIPPFSPYAFMDGIKNSESEGGRQSLIVLKKLKELRRCNIVNIKLNIC
jgi:hypothetical protein